MNALPESILERLKKIQALAESGIEGERVNAQRLLDELLAKYNVSLEELAGGQTFRTEFRYRTAAERKLLAQIVMKVCSTRKVKHHPGTGDIQVFYLTRAQAADVGDAYTHYKAELKRSLDDVLSALCYRHNLFAPDEEGDEAVKPSAEAEARAQRIISLMRGMDTKDWKKTFLLTE